MTVGLLFAGRGGPSDYGRRLARLRWRRAFPEAPVRERDADEPAADAVGGAAAWIAVRDEAALPLAGARVSPVAGRVVLCAPCRAFDPAPPHTLRELEDVRGLPRVETPARSAAALAFRPADFPPGEGESLGEYLGRLSEAPTPRDVASDFPVLALEDAFERERPEVVRHVPSSARRLLDVGCGAGAASAALKRERPGLTVEGIESDPVAAARAHSRLDRVHVGDAFSVLRALLARGERYDALLFADVLEHLANPVAALELGASLGAPGACLVASVPNVGHLSLVRDLIQGRFDPAPAGLADAGHLRWFSRGSLAATLEEAGWVVEAALPAPGAAVADADAFLARLESWPGLDRESLGTYQWIAVARLDKAPAGAVESSHAAR